MKPAPARLSYAHPAFHGWIGYAETEHTPPVGVYSRLWGAARHDVARAVHRPLKIKALTFREGPESPPLIFLSLELCLIRDPEDSLFREKIRSALGLDDSARVIIQCTHTHGSVPFSLNLQNRPGADLLTKWCREHMETATRTAIAAVSNSSEAELSWEAGSCPLATHRDLPVPRTTEDTFACGYHPEGEADRTLTVGRICRHDRVEPVALLAHYACHPTTLAWENDLLSPDYIGSADELIRERAGCPLVFLQGASGELAPRRQYTGDPEVADRNGRVLGYSVLSLFENMLPAFEEIRMEEVVTSGADLAVWRTSPRREKSASLAAFQSSVDLPLIPRPSVAELRDQLATEKETALRERLERQILRESRLDGQEQLANPVFFWKLGDCVWIAQSQEAYSDFQTELRRAFPGKLLLPLNVANGPHISYLYPARLSGKPIYQVDVSLFAPRSLDLLIGHCRNELETLLNPL